MEKGLLNYRRALFLGHMQDWLGITLLVWFSTAVAETLLGTAIIILAQVVPIILLQMMSFQLPIKRRTLLLGCRAVLILCMIVLGCFAVTGALTAWLYFCIGMIMGFTRALHDPVVASLLTEFTKDARKEAQKKLASAQAEEQARLTLAKTELRANYGRIVALASAPMIYFIAGAFELGSDSLGVLFWVRAGLVAASAYYLLRSIPQHLQGVLEKRAHVRTEGWAARQNARLKNAVAAFQRVFSASKLGLGWLFLLIFVKQSFPWLWYLGPAYLNTVVGEHDPGMLYLLYRALGGVLWTMPTLLVCFVPPVRRWVQGTDYPEKRLCSLLVVTGLMLIWYPINGTLWALIVGTGVTSVTLSAFELAVLTKINTANENDSERSVYAVRNSVLSVGTLMMLPGSWLATEYEVGNAITVLGAATVVCALLIAFFLYMKEFGREASVPVNK